MICVKRLYFPFFTDKLSHIPVYLETVNTRSNYKSSSVGSHDSQTGDFFTPPHQKQKKVYLLFITHRSLLKVFLHKIVLSRLRNEENTFLEIYQGESKGLHDYTRFEVLVLCLGGPSHRIFVTVKFSKREYISVRLKRFDWSLRRGVAVSPWVQGRESTETVLPVDDPVPVMEETQGGHPSPVSSTPPEWVPEFPGPGYRLMWEVECRGPSYSVDRCPLSFSPTLYVRGRSSCTGRC